MAWALEFNNGTTNEYATLGTELTCTNFDIVLDAVLLGGEGWITIAGGLTENNLLRLDVSSSSASFLCRFNKRTVRTLNIPLDLRNFDGELKVTFRPGGVVSFYVDNVLQDTQTNASDLEFIYSQIARYGELTSGNAGFQLRSLSYVDYAGSDSFFLDATLSDHNSNPPVLIDTIGGNNATGVNMTDANWIDLGGDNSLTVTEDSIFTIADTTITTSTSSVTEDSDLAFDDTSDLLVTASLIENSEITLDDTSELAGKTIIIDSSELEIVDTTTVVFRTSGNSLNATEDTELALVDSTTVAFRSTISENANLSITDSTLNYFQTVLVEDGVFSASDETITAFSASIAENAVLEIVDTTIVNFTSGDFNPIIGLTLELSSDIITLELSSEQEIRELA